MTAFRLRTVSPLEQLESDREDMIAQRMYLAKHKCPEKDGCEDCERRRSDQNWYTGEVARGERELELSPMTAEDEQALELKIITKREDLKKDFDALTQANRRPT